MKINRRNFKPDTYRLQTLCDYFKNANLRTITPLNIERFRASRRKNGIDIETVRELLGHHSIVVTQRYVHSNDDRKKKAVELLNNKQGNAAEKRENLAHQCHTERMESFEKLPAYLFSIN